MISETYKDIHRYGKRSEKKREVIVRNVPAIVTEAVWSQPKRPSDATFCSGRGTRDGILLRGLIKCRCCGLTYVGTSSRTKAGMKSYYICNG